MSSWSLYSSLSLSVSDDSDYYSAVDELSSDRSDPDSPDFDGELEYPELYELDALEEIPEAEEFEEQASTTLAELAASVSTFVVSEAQQEQSVRTVSTVSWSLGMASTPHPFLTPGDAMPQDPHPKANEKGQTDDEGNLSSQFPSSVTKSRSLSLLQKSPNSGFVLPQIPITAPDELAGAMDEVAEKWSFSMNLTEQRRDEDTNEASTLHGVGLDCESGGRRTYVLEELVAVGVGSMQRRDWKWWGYK
ncbi:MAG: hypothetical protein Q9208_007849 [Pyrenodesmia sp. 3 TL-2023]